MMRPESYRIERWLHIGQKLTDDYTYLLSTLKLQLIIKSRISFIEKETPTLNNQQQRRQSRTTTKQQQQQQLRQQEQLLSILYCDDNSKSWFCKCILFVRCHLALECV